MPSCMTFKGVGCYIKNGYYINHLLVDSPDGLITNEHNDQDSNCCNQDVYNGVMTNISVEIKSPYPDPCKLPVHYKLLRCYVMQVLMHMNCTQSSTNIYASVGSNSLTFIECQYNDYLFRDLWDRLCFYYDKTHPTQPKKLSELPEEFNS